MPELNPKFAMPTRLHLDDETASETYGKFIAEPLEKGFGHTLGNALRRVLWSSLDGVAITWIKIDGVQHEFTTIPHVIEDVTDIVLNFKRVIFECSGDLPRKLELKVSHKAGAVSAGAIATDGVTRVINPDQHLLTIDKPIELYIEMEIDKGRGYRVADDNKQDDHAIGVIPIDSLFSPIRRVAYAVHDCRVGQRTDYDKLELEVWTDGRIEPRDAVTQAAQILNQHLAVFMGLDGQQGGDAPSLITSAEDESMLRKLLLNVNDLELSVRALNCLNNANIRTIGEMVQKTEAEMLKFRNFGQKSLNELKEKLVDLGLHLAMELKEEVRIAFEKELERQRGAKGE
jgi:DNA-directed RNA polymerase subunit alpha